MAARTRLALGTFTLTALALAAGCSDAHLRLGDAGEPGDAAPTTCHAGDTPPWTTYCVYVGADHVCGDAAQTPECVDGAWRCPAGTSDSSACWCSGFGGGGPGCVCTPSGWSCPPMPADAGVDAPPACPSDPAGAIGTACAVEGQSCGECPTPCSGFCNLITCSGGTWGGLELGCADTTFACGPSTWCNRWSEYCEHVLSDVTGIPDDYRCSSFPDGCPNDCACWADAPGSGSCSSDGGGGVTLTFGGG